MLGSGSGVPRAVHLLAILAMGLITLLTFGTVAALLVRADLGDGIRASDWAAIRFTIGQALLSALLSVFLAVPLARAIARRQFFGRRVLVTLLGAPFILPVIVAVLGLLAVFGRNGLLNTSLAAFGIEPVSIYGLAGVVMAHVFFNLPLATRFLLQGWAAIPAERFRLAAALGFGPWGVFRHLEWPMLRAAAPRAFVLIFLICLTSFAVALTLGGGPRATTIELAIYQAFSFDFDLGRAARLALIQIALGLGGGVIALILTLPDAFGAGLDRWDASGWAPKAVDVMVIGVVGLFLILPLAMVAARGVPHLGALPVQVWPAMARTLAVALGSVAVMVATALPLAIWAGRRGGALVEGAGLMMLAASPLVIGTGLFLILFPLVDPTRAALPVTAVVNAMAALPFALRVLAPAVAHVERDFGKLAASLGMSPWARIRLVTLPRISQPLMFACGLTGALSVGDLGVITLFAASDAPTLPLLIYRLMGSYQMDAAAAVAVLLVATSLAMFWLFDRGGRGRA